MTGALHAATPLSPHLSLHLAMPAYPSPLHPPACTLSAQLLIRLGVTILAGTPMAKCICNGECTLGPAKVADSCRFMQDPLRVSQAGADATMVWGADMLVGVWSVQMHEQRPGEPTVP